MCFEAGSSFFVGGTEVADLLLLAAKHTHGATVCRLVQIRKRKSSQRIDLVEGQKIAEHIGIARVIHVHIVIDIGINALIIWNIYNLFINSSGGYFTNTLFWCNVVLFVLYSVMRYYIYVQMVTFKLTVFKILKNSLIFSLLGFKRNLMATLGILAGLLIELICVIGVGGILLPFGIALPFIILFSSFAYMKVYASYFKIKEIMIDPYLAEHPEEAPEYNNDDVIMSDDVTELERLEEIKRRNSM